MGTGVAVPLMALVVSPLQAAAVLLPILCLMDLVGLWVYRGKWLWPELRILVPASMVGIVAGTLLFGFMSAATVRIIVGIVAIAFTAHYAYSIRHRPDSALPHFPPAVGYAAGAAGGSHQAEHNCREKESNRRSFHLVLLSHLLSDDGASWD